MDMEKQVMLLLLLAIILLVVAGVRGIPVVLILLELVAQVVAEQGHLLLLQQMQHQEPLIPVVVEVGQLIQIQV
jgi:hypothetical protein